MHVALGWIFSTGVCLACLFGIDRFQGESDASVAESAVYLSFTRLGWGLGLSWVVFACIFGYGGIYFRLLSPNYHFLSRIPTCSSLTNR